MVGAVEATERSRRIIDHIAAVALPTAALGALAIENRSDPPTFWSIAESGPFVADTLTLAEIL